MTHITSEQGYIINFMLNQGGKPIEKRSDIVDSRSIFGDLEVDLIIDSTIKKLL